MSRYAIYPIGPFQTRLLETITETPGLEIRGLAIRMLCTPSRIRVAVSSLLERKLITTKMGRTRSGQTGRLCYPVPA